MEIDLSIALLQKEQWKKKQEEFIQQETEIYDLKKKIEYTLEELIEGIKKEKLFLYTLKMNFETKEVLEGTLKIPFVIDFFDLVVEEEHNLLFVSDKRNVSMSILSSYKGQMKPMKEWLSEIKTSYKKINMQMQMCHSNSINQMEYLCYEIPTSAGMTYNISFCYQKNKVLYSGSFNCLSEEKKGMGLLLEAFVHVIEEINR